VNQICFIMSRDSLSNSNSESSFKHCDSQVEFLLDEEGWKDEAKGVIKDIESYVKSVTVACEIPSTNSQIFLNLVTKEDQEYTVALNSEGFKVVGFSFNTTDVEGETVYETPYSLLDNLSPAYREAFGQDLTEQLLKLQRQRGEEEESRD